MSRLASLVLLLAWLAAAPAVLAQDQRPPPIVAVFLMESRGSPLSGDELVGLTDYMATRLGEQGRFQIIPRDEIKKRLAEQKSSSYKDCVDQSCQIEIGRELAAQYTVTSSISKVGNKCLITAALYDLRKAATVKTASSKKTCDPDQLINAVESITDNLQAKMLGSQQQKPIAPPPAPAPAPKPAPQPPVATAPPAEQPAATATSRAPVQASPGWSLGAGIAGIISAGTVLTLSIGSAATVPDSDITMSMSLGGAATLALVVMGPVTFAGSRSAYGDESVHGSVGLRVGGWICYGVSVLNALSLLAMGAAEVDVEDEVMMGMVLVTGGVGALGLTLFSIDSFIAHGQAKSLLAANRPEETDGLRLAPVITPVLPPADHPGAGGLTVGLVGRF